MVGSKIVAWLLPKLHKVVKRLQYKSNAFAGNLEQTEKRQSEAWSKSTKTDDNVATVEYDQDPKGILYRILSFLFLLLCTC